MSCHQVVLDTLQMIYWPDSLSLFKDASNVLSALDAPSNLFGDFSDPGTAPADSGKKIALSVKKNVLT